MSQTPRLAQADRSRDTISGSQTTPLGLLGFVKTHAVIREVRVELLEAREEEAEGEEGKWRAEEVGVLFEAWGEASESCVVCALLDAVAFGALKTELVGAPTCKSSALMKASIDGCPFESQSMSSGRSPHSCSATKWLK
eukprot:1771450-Pleurochrysis_carterae.AAC.3